MRAGIIGLGHVGAAVALSINYLEEINLYDINPTRINNFFTNQHEVLKSVSETEYTKIQWDKFTPFINGEDDFPSFIDSTEIFFICLPTDPLDTGKLNINLIVNTLEKIQSSKQLTTKQKTPVIIKSTMNVGDCAYLSSLYENLDIVFMPEFLSEGREHSDSTRPNRVVVGLKNSHDFEFIDRLYSFFQLDKKSSNIHFVSYEEAEIIKLASNSYLAMRIAFFNEVAHFVKNELSGNVKNVIEGICLDDRIGNYYNNPSFGFGGYCLPKDCMALRTCLNEAYPLINYIYDSNEVHIQRTIEYVVKFVRDFSEGAETKLTIGFYGFEYKKGVQSTRESALDKIFQRLLASSVPAYFLAYNKTLDIEEFKSKCDLILTNRYSSVFDDVSNKVYSYDIFPGREFV